MVAILMYIPILMTRNRKMRHEGAHGADSSALPTRMVPPKGGYADHWWGTG